jgi:hypothetical protein
MADETEPSSGETGTEEKEEEGKAPPSGGKTASEFRDIADTLRNRVDLFGKTLAAIATLGTTAVGLSKIGDLFPAEGWGWLAVVLACLGLATAALAAIAVAVRLMGVGRPVFLDPDLDNTELDEGERKDVLPVYEGAAKRFGYTSLVGLRERERILRNAAARATDAEDRARRTTLADEVKTEIEQALARSQVVVVRRRATEAVGGWSWLMYVLGIVGLILFAAGTDWVSSDREDLVAKAKACGEAREAGATKGELERTDGDCDAQATTGGGESKPPSAVEARAEVTVQLAAALKACAALVHKAGDAASGPLRDESCDSVRDAISTVMGGSGP